MVGVYPRGIGVLPGLAGVAALTTPSHPRGAAAAGGADSPDTGHGLGFLTRRRRPPSALEQERRRAWGKLWGGINREHAIKQGWKKGSA